MKKLIVYALGIITALSVTYAGFQVIQGETILNGRLLLQGSGLAWDDIQNLQMWDTDAVAQKPALTAISGSTIKTRCFDGGTQINEMFGNVEIPHDIYTDTGAILSPHVHRMGSTTSNSTGVRLLEFLIRKVNGTYTDKIIKATIADNIIAWQPRISYFNSFSATGLTLGDTISFRIYRNPNTSDTYAGALCLSQIGFHYQKDSLGSRSEYIK